MILDPDLRTGGGVLKESGKPTDPVLLPESLLVGKELDQGPSYFQLQHMLNTALSDENRYPLKPKNLMTLPLNMDKAPSDLTWMASVQHKLPITGYAKETDLYRPFAIGTELYDYESKYLYVDTAGGGQNGDETVAWVVAFLHGYIFALEMLPLPGGYDNDVFAKLSDLAYRHQVNEIGCEMNHGYGSFAQMWRPVLLKHYQDLGSHGAPKIDDDWATTQKETRIIDTLEPFFARHRIVFDAGIWDTDRESVVKYPLDEREVYTLYNQIARITKQKGCLVHDDRIDGLAGAVRRYVEKAAIDDEKKRATSVSSENLKMMAEFCPEFATSLTPSMASMIPQQRKARRTRNTERRRRRN